MKLNLGCGNDYKEGFINVDKGDCHCDVKHDIEIFPWPFENNSVEYILLQHIMEHIHREKFIDFCRELYRVCKNNAHIHIISPYAMSDNFFTDPTHIMPLTTRTFDYFDKTKPLGENGKIYGWDDINFRVNSTLKKNGDYGPDVIHDIIVIK